MMGFLMGERNRPERARPHPELDADEPSRTALAVLAEVKAHSQALAAPEVAAEEAPPEEHALVGEWAQRDWRQAFCTLFVETAEAGGARPNHQDDMLFFVRSAEDAAAASAATTAGTADQMPFFVRRWAPELPLALPEPERLNGASPFHGREEAGVDWRQSVYLNLVLHTTYTLTVAVCSRQAIQAKQQGAGSAWSPLVKVSSLVYASPTRISVDCKQETTMASFPDVFFALEDTEAHQYVVLNDPDHCLCVLLSAKGGPALPCEPAEAEHDGSQQQPPQLVEPRVLVFSGFVGYDQLQNAYASAHRRFGGFLPGRQGDAAKVMMRGPGANGEAEVAVSEAVTVDTGEASGEARGLPKRGLVRKAMSAATALGGAAAFGLGLAPAARQAEGNPLQLQCSLVSVSLPCRVLAHDLLFKPCT